MRWQPVDSSAPFNRTSRWNGRAGGYRSARVVFNASSGDGRQHGRTGVGSALKVAPLASAKPNAGR